MALSCVPVGGAGPPTAPVVPAAQPAAPGSSPFQAVLQGWLPGVGDDAGQTNACDSRQLQGNATGSGPTSASGSTAAADRQGGAGDGPGAAQDDGAASAAPEDEDRSKDKPVPVPDGVSEGAAAPIGQAVAALLAQVPLVSPFQATPQAGTTSPGGGEPAVEMSGAAGPTKAAASCAGDTALSAAQNGVVLRGASAPGGEAAAECAQPVPAAVVAEGTNKEAQVSAQTAEAPAGDVLAGLSLPAESAVQAGTVERHAQAPDDKRAGTTPLGQTVPQPAAGAPAGVSQAGEATGQDVQAQATAQGAVDGTAGTGPGTKAGVQTGGAIADGQAVTGGTVQAKAEVGKAPAGTAQPNPLRQVLAQQDLASAGAPEGAPAAWKSADAGTAGTPAASSDSDQSTQSGGERLIHLGAGIAQAGSQTAGTGFSVNATQGKPVAQPALAFDVRSLAGQIVRHAQAWVHEGQTDVRLQLDPPNLGQVEVRLSHQEQGVSITLAAGQANGAQALGSRLDELRQGLVAAGVPLLDLSLEQGQTSWKQAGQGNSERPVGAAQPLPYRANPRGDVASSRGAAPSLGAGALEIWI